MKIFEILKKGSIKYFDFQKFLFMRYSWSWGILWICRTFLKNLVTFQTSCGIFTKKNLVITSYLKSKSLKFRKDPSFCWGDISLFVTVYDLELKILSFLKTQKNAILNGKKRTLRFIFFKTFFDENGWTCVICHTQKTVQNSDIYWPRTSE